MERAVVLLKIKLKLRKGDLYLHIPLRFTVNALIIMIDDNVVNHGLMFSLTRIPSGQANERHKLSPLVWCIAGIP